MALSVTQLIGFGSGGYPRTLIGVLQSLGLTSNLVYALDAGDTNSYPSGTQWLDTSGNANHYQFGSLVGGDANDPTFNGVAGALDETNYFSSGGNDYFSIVTSPTTFDDGWAKDNGAVTLMVVFWPNGSVAHAVAGDMQALNPANGGCRLFINNSERVGFQYNINDISGAGATLASTATVTLTSINYIATAFDEATTSGIINVNSTQETASGLTAITGTNNPGRDWRIGDGGDGNGMSSNDRIYCAAAWSTKLTATQLSALYTTLKSVRFPSLP